MAKTSTDIDFRGIEKKLSESNYRKGRYALANQALSDMNRYVPRREGVLRMSTSINLDATAINYHAPYAKKQFYTSRGWSYTTPGTGPRWDLKAKNNHGRNWAKAFVKGAGL